jgi:DNA-binding NarL/FixJ family response regulator
MSIEFAHAALKRRTAFARIEESTRAGAAMDRHEDIVLIERPGLLRECLLRCLADAFGGKVEAVDATSRLSDGHASKATLAVLSLVDKPCADVREEIAAAFWARPGVSIVLLSAASDADHALSALHAGAKAFLSMDMSLQAMIEAVRVVQAGGYCPPPSAAPAMHARLRLARAAPAHLFTVRQAEVIDALRRGKANKTIAYELNMGESTVKVHVRNIMKKLKARNRTEIAFLAGAMALRKA